MKRRLLYGTLALLAFWARSPERGLYRVPYYLPAFSFLRAPARLGLVVVLCLAVLAAIALRHLFDALPPRRRSLAAAIAVVLAMADVAVFPLKWSRAPDLPSPYAVLAQSQRAPVAEFPFYGERIAFPLHAQYMLFSTSHWMPLVNGYSDVIPLDFARRPWSSTVPVSRRVHVLARRPQHQFTVHVRLRQDEIRSDWSRCREPGAGVRRADDVV